MNEVKVSSSITLSASYSTVMSLMIAPSTERVLKGGLQPQKSAADDYELRKIFSIFFPFANSSTSLSKYLTCCVKGFLISSMR